MLPSDMTKDAVYQFYEKACESIDILCLRRISMVSPSNHRLYAEDSKSIWHDLYPYVAVMKQLQIYALLPRKMLIC